MTGKLRLLGVDWRATLERLAELDRLVAPLRGQLDLSRTEFHTLLVLWQDGPATMSEVARRADVSRTAMTTLTDRLEKRGLLRRIPDERDRRCTLLSTSARFEQDLESIAAT